ncbi:MAG: acetyl-CoA C-acyltransferase [Pirellulaceae bacterium]
MKTAVVVDCVRTPIGRAHVERGVYRKVRGDDLAAVCIKALIERTGIDPEIIEDIVLGCTQQTKEQGLNAARIIGLMSGGPISAGGATINRLCGSSLQALNQAAHSIAAGAEDVHIVGGFEHMQHVPMDHGIDLNPKLFHRTSMGAMQMGYTAEFLAQTMDISRSDQDEFAFASHQKAENAYTENAFADELVEVHGHDEQGIRVQVTKDQCVRPDTSMVALSELSPAFMPKYGTVTAGNSSPLNDGAAAMLVMSETRASELGLRPMAKILSTAVAGVEPAAMGTGPIPAATKALARAGLSSSDIGLIELNEAFAAQSLACIRRLKWDLDRINVRGGSIAIGHPLGASGARISTTLLHAMRSGDVEFGLATMCIGIGQGIATVFQQVA